MKSEKELEDLLRKDLLSKIKAHKASSSRSIRGLVPIKLSYTWDIDPIVNLIVNLWKKLFGKGK